VADVGGITGVCELMLGGNAFGWTADEGSSFAVLDRYVEMGGNFIDTADVYMMWGEGLSGGESETILGRWLTSRGNRDDVFIATKVGMWTRRLGLSRNNINLALEDSLCRLQTDYVDLYLSHIDDPETPQEEVLETFTALVKEGKVREIGASNLSPERLRSALEISDREALARFVAFQTPYNLMDRQAYETAFQSWVGEAGLAILPYYSLAQGFLTGKYQPGKEQPGSARAVKVAKYRGDRGERVVKVLESVAESYGVSPPAIALAWLRSHPEIVAPIASATSPTQLDQLLASLGVTLAQSEVEALDAASRT
jgi:aryl-alcohol dehydrogenase (NADP+)